MNLDGPVAVSASAAEIKSRYTEVRQRIAAAAKKSGRTPEQVVLVAVTKTAEPDQIRELIKLGHADLGENRVQQLLQRTAIIDEWMARHRSMPGVQWQQPLGDRDPFSAEAQRVGNGSGTGLPAAIRWHMIGHVQRNKARKVVDLCRLIHSVDSLRIAEELQLVALKKEKPIEVLLQVNCSHEPQKYGCAIAATLHLAEQIETMVHVQLRGLMTMAAANAGESATRDTFARCRELFEEVRASGIVPPRFNILSMGMSGDYEMAIQEGSNMVRVGSAIFGEPKPGMEQDEDGDED
jgi:pyridoxal phosphate enzyme (YggS family)